MKSLFQKITVFLKAAPALFFACGANATNLSPVGLWQRPSGAYIYISQVAGSAGEVLQGYLGNPGSMREVAVSAQRWRGSHVIYTLEGEGTLHEPSRFSGAPKPTTFLAGGTTEILAKISFLGHDAKKVVFRKGIDPDQPLGAAIPLPVEAPGLPAVDLPNERVFGAYRNPTNGEFIVLTYLAVVGIDDGSKFIRGTRGSWHVSPANFQRGRLRGSGSTVTSGDYKVSLPGFSEKSPVVLSGPFGESSELQTMSINPRDLADLGITIETSPLSDASYSTLEIPDWAKDKLEVLAAYVNPASGHWLVQLKNIANVAPLHTLFWAKSDEGAFYQLASPSFDLIESNVPFPVHSPTLTKPNHTFTLKLSPDGAQAADGDHFVNFSPAGAEQVATLQERIRGNENRLFLKALPNARRPLLLFQIGNADAHRHLYIESFHFTSDEPWQIFLIDNGRIHRFGLRSASFGANFPQGIRGFSADRNIDSTQREHLLVSLNALRSPNEVEPAGSLSITTAQGESSTLNLTNQSLDEEVLKTLGISTAHLFDPPPVLLTPCEEFLQNK